MKSRLSATRSTSALTTQPAQEPHAHPLLSLTTEIPPELEALITTGLNTFNNQTTGYADHQVLAIIARDPETNAIRGGALGRSSRGVIFPDLLYSQNPAKTPAPAPKSSSNRKARRRLCLTGLLNTLSFQAPAVYERHSRPRFTEFPCRPEGTSRILSNQL